MEFNATPMVDVFFLLTIFFMLVVTGLLFGRNDSLKRVDIPKILIIFIAWRSIIFILRSHER